MTTIAELGIRVDSGDAAHAATDLDKLVEAGGRAEKAAAGVEQSAKKAGQALRGQADDLAQLLGEIDPTVKALSRLDELESRLAKQKKLLDPEIFSEYQGKIQQSREALTRFDDSLTRTGNTAKQNAAALRGVPAQFTDIFVSLQGGQAPLTVLLQQGGQLKDMFGGVGPAIQALGGYVLGLVNPFTVAAAAVGVLGYAYYSGSEEAVEFQKALITTGNAAGTTSDRLSGMAREVAATVGTTGTAAEVLTQLASSGKVASNSFVEITEAALEWRSATGKAVEDTVAEFVKIGKDPVAAAKDLNEQYNFLTAATYSQIVALKEQGDTIGAAKLLTDTYVDTIKNRSKEVTENLSIWERGWKVLRGEVAATVDSVKNIGRDQDIASRIVETQQRLAAAQSAVNGDPDDTAAQKKLADANLELKALIQQRDTQQAIAKAQELDAQRQQAAIVAIGKIDALEKSARTNAEKRADALKEYAKSLEAIRKVNPDDERLKPENIARVQADIAKQFKDSAGRTTSVDLSGFNDQKNGLAAILSEYKNHQKELDAAHKAGIISQESYAAQRAAIIEQQKGEVTNAYEAEIAALEVAKDKVGTTAAQHIQLDQKIADARASMVKAQKDADSELAVLAMNEEGRLRKQAQAVQTYTSALEQQVKALRLQGQRSAEGLGLGDRQRGLQDQQNGITDRINQQKLDLANQYGDGSRGMSLDEYNQKLAALDKTQRDLQETAIANYNDMTAAQGGWSAGASSAFQNYLESARDVAGQTKSLFTNAFSSMEDAVANFAISGKFSFGDFTKSILADMARIATRQASSSLLSSIGGSALSAWFSGGAPASAGSTQAGYAPQIMDSFVSGQRAAGGPVAANSLYQVNELGPELLNQGGKTYLMMGAEGGTITPLGTGPVSAATAGGGGGTVIHVSVSIDGEGNAASSTDTAGYEQFGSELATFVEQKYNQMMAKDLRQGGRINTALKGR